MSIDVSWDNTGQTIIRYQFGLQWTWQDFSQAVAQSNAMMETVAHTVSIIADFCSGTPPPLGAMGQFKKAWEVSPSNLGVVVVAGGGAFINMMVSVFLQLNAGRDSQLCVAHNAENARQQIAAL